MWPLFARILLTGRIGLLTLGASVLPLYQNRVAQIGIGSRVVAYAAPEVPMAFGTLAVGAVPDILDVLATACSQMHQAGAQVVVLAGAVLCGYAAALQSRCAMPVLDGVDCAVRQLRMMSDQARTD